jgi:uncharacterized protein with HEPN domain
MSRDVRLYLENIQLSCQKIIRYTAGWKSPFCGE